MMAGMLVSALQAQDTLVLDLATAESIFLEENLELIAQEYEISRSNAEGIQVKLWPNPNLDAEIAMYDLEDKIWFQTGSRAQRALELRQLVELGGKRKKRIQLSNVETEIAELEYYNLLRHLKTRLRTSFASLYYARKSTRALERGLAFLESMMEDSLNKEGENLLNESEVIRLKSLLMNLERTWLDHKNRTIHHEETLKKLLNLNPRQLLEVKMDEAYLLRFYDTDFSIDSLMALADSFRFDIRIQDARVNWAANSLKLEKAIAVPDLNLGVSYDRLGSFQNNYFALVFDIDLPFFNRNQGNVQVAQINVEQARTTRKRVLQEVEAEIVSSLSKLNNTESHYLKLDLDLLTGLQQLIRVSLAQLQAGEISLVEFVDSFNAFRDNILNLLAVQEEIFAIQEELNFVVGIDLFDH